MKKEKDEQYKNLLSIKSIAIIGVSRNVEKAGAKLFRNLIYNGFEGDVYPINPNVAEIYDHPCYSSIGALPIIPELLIIATPKETVLSLVQEAIEHHITQIMVVGKGFAEAGEQGMLLQKKIAEICKNAGVTLLGPNATGLVNPSNKINLSIEEHKEMPMSGGLVFVSQSQLFLNRFIDFTNKYRLGVSIALNIGNKASLTEIDILEYYNTLPADQLPSMIGLAIDNIAEGEHFAQLVQSLSLKLPVIVFVSGKGELARNLAVLHSGAFRQDNKVIELAVRQNGGLYAQTFGILLDVMKVFAWQPKMHGEKTAVIADTTVSAMSLVSQIERLDLSVSNLYKIDQQNNVAMLAEKASKQEDVDIILLGTVREDLIIDSLEQIADINRTQMKPVIITMLGGMFSDEGFEKLKQFHIPIFSDSNLSIDVISLLAHYRTFLAKRQLSPNLNILHKTLDIDDNKLARLHSIIEKYKTRGAKILKKRDLIILFDMLGMRYHNAHSFSTFEELLSLSKELGLPVQIEDTESGRVKVINDEDELKPYFMRRLQRQHNYVCVVDSSIDILQHHKVSKYIPNQSNIEVNFRRDYYLPGKFNQFTNQSLYPLSFGSLIEVSLIGWELKDSIVLLSTNEILTIKDSLRKLDMGIFTKHQTESTDNIINSLSLFIDKINLLLSEVQNINKIKVVFGVDKTQLYIVESKIELF